MNVRLREAVERIRAQSGGRVDIQIFPNSQLGGDTDMLSQLRTGAIQMFNLSGLILSTFVPLASINGIGFAFKDYDQVWSAMDGALGAFIRAAIAKSGLYAFGAMWDNGYRQITSSTHPINAPDDLKGFKIRVPVSPLWTSMFKAFGASPASININEAYSAHADQDRRGPGKSAGADRPLQVLRGAEIRLRHQPHVGRVLDARQRPDLGVAAEGPAGRWSSAISMPPPSRSAPTCVRSTPPCKAR